MAELGIFRFLEQHKFGGKFMWRKGEIISCNLTLLINTSLLVVLFTNNASALNDLIKFFIYDSKLIT